MESIRQCNKIVPRNSACVVFVPDSVPRIRADNVYIMVLILSSLYLICVKLQISLALDVVGICRNQGSSRMNRGSPQCRFGSPTSDDEKQRHIRNNISQQHQRINRLSTQFIPTYHFDRLHYIS
jgi:hypothetical protein